MGDHKDRPYGDKDHTDMGDLKDRPYGGGANRPSGTLPDTVGRLIQGFKSITTHQYTVGVKQSDWPRFNSKLWQRNYYEHIVRDQNSFNLIREYIVNNPAQWLFDREHPEYTIIGSQSESLTEKEPWRV
jgi:hypothetical protein